MNSFPSDRLASSWRARPLLALSGAGLLAGCDMVVLQPPGLIAAQQAQLLVISTVLMLLIIVPVIALTLLFAWRYRASNKDAAYEPDWDHSIQLELVIWSAPLLIIIALGALTWIGTHTLNPYRPLDPRGDPAGVESLDIQVVALDWKWLFIYPEQGIATVNELAAPVDVPVRFSITSASVMNSFFIPALAGQIYAMPTMDTKLHALISQPGQYEGFSANYSGAGFSSMRFAFRAMSAADFERWVQGVQAGGQALTREAYLQLEKPSEREPVRGYGTVAPGLFSAVVNRCVDPASPCLHAVMESDLRRIAAAWRPDLRPEALVCTAADAAPGFPRSVAERK